MSLVVPNVGEGRMLAAILNKTAPQDLVLKLYKSNTTPAEGDTAGTYTEADFSGYDDVALTASEWAVTEGAPTFAAYPQQVFTSDAGSQNQPVYGYYVVQATSGVLMWAERFADAPYTIANLGDAIKVTARIELA